MSKITAIVKQPFSSPYVTEIENSLESYQKLVNGWIECIEMPGTENVDIILNEEGKLLGLSPNVIMPEYRDCLMGTVVVVGFNPSRGSHLGLSKEQISYAMNYLNKNSARDMAQVIRSLGL